MVHRRGMPRRGSLAQTNQAKFEQIIDLVADDAYTVRGAADQVRLPRTTAERMWSDLCRRMGPQAK